MERRVPHAATCLRSATAVAAVALSVPRCAPWWLETRCRAWAPCSPPPLPLPPSLSQAAYLLAAACAFTVAAHAQLQLREALHARRHLHTGRGISIVPPHVMSGGLHACRDTACSAELACTAAALCRRHAVPLRWHCLLCHQRVCSSGECCSAVPADK